MTEDENRLFEMVFRRLTPAEFIKLLKIARWKVAGSSYQLVTKGEPLENIMVTGRVSVEVNGRIIAELTDGQFIGEMSFITGEVASATAKALEPTRYVAWSKKDLKMFIEHHPKLRLTLQAIIGADMVRKLKQIDDTKL